MKPDHIDHLLTAARPTAADVDVELSEATRRRILADAKSAPIPLRRPSRRLPMLVAAGTAVAALALGVQAILPGQVRTVVTTDPSGATATTTVTQAPAGIPAAAALEPVAQAAAKRAPLTPQGSQLTRVVMTETQGGSSVTRETYVAADGWTWIKIDSGKGGVTWLKVDSKKETQGLTTLPADPAAIDAAFRSRTGNMNGDERVFKGINEVLRTEAAPQNVKASAITTLDRIAKNPQAPVTTKGVTSTPQVTLSRVTVGGKSAIQVALTDSTGRPGVTTAMALDEATGDLLEQSLVSADTTYRGTYVSREIVGALPADFVKALGTDRVEKQA